jgi:hypothetical protein
MLIFSAIPIIPNKLSSDQFLRTSTMEDPDGCDLSELMVVENVVSGRKDIVTLFWENKLGVDVEVRNSPFQIVCCGKSMTYRIIIASSYSRDQKA